MFKKICIYIFFSFFLFSCWSNNIDEKKIVNIEKTNSGSSIVTINDNSVSFWSWLLDDKFNNNNLENQKKIIDRIISFFPNSNIDEVSINFFINNLIPSFNNDEILSLDDFKLVLKEYHYNISEIEDYKKFYYFISDSDINLDLDIDILKWAEVPWVSPSILWINKLVDFYYSQEDPYFLWDPSELVNWKYTYIQWVLEFLTYCEDYNTDKLSIFNWHEKNHLKQEYFNDYNTFLDWDVNKNTLISKYRKRQAIHLSEMDFTEPSFIEPFKALYNDKKLNCWEVIEENYNKVQKLWDIQ